MASVLAEIPVEITESESHVLAARPAGTATVDSTTWIGMGRPPRVGPELEERMMAFFDDQLDKLSPEQQDEVITAALAAGPRGTREK